MKQPINEHKRMAMGGNARGYKMGGSVTPEPETIDRRPRNDAYRTGGGVPALLKTGMPKSPLTKAKSANGIPGMKKGGRA